uniref:Uncharacterized protein n=1 Tax=Steinernema glaseri TaxID=37863 RepID=A0A1I7YGE0_9BILA
MQKKNLAKNECGYENLPSLLVTVSSSGSQSSTSNPALEGIVTSKLVIEYTAQAGSKGLLLQYDVEKSDDESTEIPPKSGPSSTTRISTTNLASTTKTEGEGTTTSSKSKPGSTTTPLKTEIKSTSTPSSATSEGSESVSSTTPSKPDSTTTGHNRSAGFSIFFGLLLITARAFLA